MPRGQTVVKRRFLTRCEFASWNIESCMKVKVTNIVYDIDIDDDSSQFVLNSDLPSEMIVEVDGIIDVESEIADAISDRTGWCVQGYNYEIL